MNKAGNILFVFRDQPFCFHGKMRPAKYRSDLSGYFEIWFMKMGLERVWLLSGFLPQPLLSAVLKCRELVDSHKHPRRKRSSKNEVLGNVQNLVYGLKFGLCIERRETMWGMFPLSIDLIGFYLSPHWLRRRSWLPKPQMKAQVWKTHIYKTPVKCP